MRARRLAFLLVACVALGGCDFFQVPATTGKSSARGNVVVTPRTGLVTSEAGQTATFTVALGAAPTADVTLTVSSADPAQGTVLPTTLSFTPLNWNAPQAVTVRAVDNPVADGDRTFDVAFAPAQSTDAWYDRLAVDPVPVEVLDDETAGVLVEPTSGLVTTEAGGTASFSVRLRSTPKADVTIPVASSNASEGRVSATTLTFTPTNWNAPQEVRVTGVDDSVADGDQPYRIVLGPTSSADTAYAGITPPGVSVTNVDDESPGFLLSRTSGLTTTEAGGTDTFTIALTSQPTANVTVPLSSSNPAEGSVSPASVVFTPANWRAPQVVTVTGVDDAIADGNQPYAIVTGAAVSTDPKYAGVDPPDVSVTNVDNETPGIALVASQPLRTTEAGGKATFTVALTSQPTAGVSLAVSSSNAAEGTVSPAILTFGPTSWRTPQTVTVTGVDDPVADGNQPYTVTVSPSAATADPKYAAIAPAQVAAVNVDDDSAGFIVMPTSGLRTTEAGGTATFTIVLTSKPAANVSIPLSSSAVAEGTVSPSTLTFTPSNWNVAQTVTVKGVDDFVADGDQVYRIITGAATSSDPAYSGLDPADVSVTNTDDDTARVSVSPVSIQTTQTGGTATFDLVLGSRPLADVTIPIASSSPADGLVSTDGAPPAATTSVTFTPETWNVARTVTVTGLMGQASGDTSFTVTTGAAVSTDPAYTGLDAADVAVLNVAPATPPTP